MFRPLCAGGDGGGATCEERRPCHIELVI